VPSRIVTLRLPIDVPASLAAVRAGRGDPAVRLSPGEAVVATRTPEGTGTLRLRGGGHEVIAEAWGEGASWLLERAPAIAGAEDRLDGFEPSHPVVEHLARRHAGIRIIRTGAVLETLVRAVVGQKVTGREAGDGYRRMARALGEPAPGPVSLLVPPDPEVLAGLAYHRFHPWGIERKRAETIIGLARRRRRIAETVTMDRAPAYRRLEALRGVGPWTGGIVGGVAFGDPDAVPVGDFHIPDLVTWALAGEPRGDDGRMLELLEPYAGHRGRVIRLLKAAGFHPPRYGPRSTTRSFRTS
jgi:3-methyladenine DNA glycosylase/8-oxoguanine DNA glycosylase